MAKAAKTSPLTHIVFVDTSILWLEDKGPAVNPEFDKFWEDHKTLLQIELVVPEMVRDELLVQHCTSGQKLMAKVSEHLNALSAITTKKHKHRLSIDGMKDSVKAKFNRWISEKEARVAETPVDEIDWKNLCKRSTWRLPPFSPVGKDTKGREVEKGFRDALILETVEKVVRKESRNVNFVFLCGDEILRTATAERLKDERRFHVFERLEDFSSYIKLTKEKLEKQFSEKLLKRAAERFYTNGDPQCLWNRENLFAQFSRNSDAWKIDVIESEPMQNLTRSAVGGAQGNLLQNVEASAAGRWIVVSGHHYFLGPHEFSRKSGKRTYHWESSALALRKFALMSNEQKRLEERVQFVEFKVFWRADVKADVRFYDVTLEAIKLLRKEFRVPKQEEISRYAIDKMIGVPEQ